jgi:hypothetical protein
MDNNTKKTQTVVLVAVVVGLLCFYGGMKYGESSAKATSSAQQANFPGGAGGGAARRGAFAQNGGVASGSVLSIDANGITLKLRDGTSKIILLSGTTPVMKSTAGSASDLTVGEQVTVAGTQNTDGSITAQSVQIRPASSTLPGFQRPNQ